MSLPTKSALLQSGLVTIDQHHKSVTANTLQVAEHFSKRPSEINRRIQALSEKGLCKIAPTYYLDRQRRKQKYYELNRDNFLLLALGFTGHQADQFRSDFIRLFNQQEAELHQWRRQALLTTDSTKRANDEVYRLQNALKVVIPDSKRCTMLFIHLQQAITKSVTGSASTKRETMTAAQLAGIKQLETLTQQEIKRLMDCDTPPEQVRDIVLAMIKAKAPTTSDQTNGKGFALSTPDNNRAGGIRQSLPNS